MEPTFFDKCARPRSKVDVIGKQVPSPSMSVLVGKNEEKPFYLNAPAGAEKILETSWTGRSKTLERGVHYLEAFLLR